MTKYEDLTFEEKQAALDQAHEIMKSNAERVKDIKDYVQSAESRYTTPILNVNELEFIIGQAERAQELEADATHLARAWTAKVEENRRLREALGDLRNRAMNVSPEREEDGSIIEDTESRFLYEFCEQALAGASDG